MDYLRRFFFNAVFEEIEPDEYRDYRPRIFHGAVNPFEELTNENFINIYRLTKKRVSELIDIVGHYEPGPTRRSALDIRTKGRKMPFRTKNNSFILGRKVFTNSFVIRMSNQGAHSLTIFRHW